nr:immunoglobulin heavy chain junction region [Macaca mulatta]MOV38547.1 immunoglobulin heavy chain junction region [Macaca mulatta]MOV38965.1 immunoglobulin heavy chain junction region [Macaca mulatta]MOV39002.1 immunoglobulin heavy chain junction region [Macaca mulatta]MOV39230.1 immunoglobulin heavy chain junction region [Macaca mulatta]
CATSTIFGLARPLHSW